MKSIDNTSLYVNAACIIGEWIYFTSYNSSWLFRLNVETKDLEALHLLFGTKTGMKFSGLYYYNGMIWMIPWSTDYIYVYKLKEAVIEQLPLPSEITEYSNSKLFRKSIIQGKYLWLLPCEYPGIVRVDMEDKSYKIFNEWPAGIFFDKTKKMNFKMMDLYDNEIYLFNDACSMSIKLSTDTGVMAEWKEGHNQLFGTISRGKLYTSPVNEYDPVKIIRLGCNEISKTLNLPENVWMKQNYLYCYWYAKKFDNKIFFMPHEANGILMMDVDEENSIDILTIDDSDYETARQNKNYAVYDILPYKEKYLTIPFQGNKIVLFNQKGSIEKEYLLQTEKKYLENYFNENNMFNIVDFANIIKSTEYVKVNWNSADYNQTIGNIGYKINKVILEGIK